MTPTGIEPAIFRFEAQHLNHCATAQSIIYISIFPFITPITIAIIIVFLSRSPKIVNFPVHAIKAYSGSGGAVPLILNLGTRWT